MLKIFMIDGYKLRLYRERAKLSKNQSLRLIKRRFNEAKRVEMSTEMFKRVIIHYNLDVLEILDLLELNFISEAKALRFKQVCVQNSLNPSDTIKALIDAYIMSQERPKNSILIGGIYYTPKRWNITSKKKDQPFGQKPRLKLSWQELQALKESPKKPVTNSYNKLRQISQYA